MQRNPSPDWPLNHFGLPITPPEYFDSEHVATPTSPGSPPVCSCGWTRWEYEPGKWFEMSDHLRDMNGARGRCNSCGDEWTEQGEIVICPECHSTDVVEVLGV